MNRKFTALILATVAFCSALFAPVKCSAETVKSTVLTTCNNPDYYASFTANGFTLTAHGKFTEATLINIHISGWDTESYSFKTEADGSFTAQLTVPNYTDGSAYAVLEFQSGISDYYKINADKNGLYFPDNVLGASSREKFGHIVAAPQEAAAYYLSATADPDEIKDTQERLKMLADEITAGVDDEYRQALLICRWVAENVYYDHDAAESSVTVDTVAVANVLDIKRTVCAGYANTYCALLQAKGLRAVNIKGSAVAGEVTYDMLATGVENHEWSAFWYEKEQRWVYVDTCWCSNNDYFGGDYHKGVSCDKYFDPTDLAFSLNHRVDKAEERDYFADFSSTVETTVPETTTAEQTLETVQTTVETSAPVTSTQRETQTTAGDLPMMTDDAGTTILLYAIISVLLIGVVVLAIALYLKKRNGKNQ